ncbi:50S ribosomal protein L5 [Candidatus Micrarchaeota archaeon]|jgi:large subunit ribosomal protein L5|nr:50S ribosomal protein L5 [Candidatus Micrarchaeota archaeon]
MTENQMRKIYVEKVTLNIGTGQAGMALENAKNLLKKITERTPVETLAKVRNPVFKIRKGDPIGAKVTLRKDLAKSVLTKALKAKKNKLNSKMFDTFGNVSFGISEYIDYPGLKYDPRIGMLGFDISVTLTRPGRRINLKKRKKSRIGNAHRITAREAINFMKTEFGVEVD